MTTQAKKRNPADGLKNSAVLATILAIVGHALLGFEQSLAQWAVAVAVGYGCTIVFELIEAKTAGTTPRFVGKGAKGVVLSFLSPHMTATTMAFLLYTNDRLDAMAFAVAAAIASKYIFRVWDGERYRHFMNPSNTGLALAFCVLPWTNTIPYQFAENVFGWYDWLVIAVLGALGFRLNLQFTGRLTLIASWLAGYVLQAVLRSAFGTSVLPAELMMMTGPAFVLFTFYMITDPMTSPSSKKSQILFGFSVGAVYGLLMVFHVVFAIFFAVTIVCGVRGLYLLYESMTSKRRDEVPVATMSPVAVGGGGVPTNAAAASQMMSRAEVG